MDTDRDLYYQNNSRLFKMKSRAAMTLVFSTKTVALLVSLKPVRWKLLVTCVKMLYFFIYPGALQRGTH